ncbi:cytidine deaminase-like isoform X2 [Bacillus rossius redtenbacheri]|uniref:cytidine deaminase-like isoform X2 n=1 Tax=Bacillus rossius redtenbacheri TaxID=93214 RepID=UPI002FDE4A2C
MSTGKVVTFSSLDEDVQALVRAALAARQRAYCPYSRFQVGAALLTTDGETFDGCNVESASYTPTICAERTAVVKAVSCGRRQFSSVAVVAHLEDSYVAPCGVCRQLLAEFGLDVAVYLAKVDLSSVLVTDLRALLPLSFGKY